MRHVVSLLTILIGVLVIVGWLTQTKSILSILPGGSTMKFNTALCFLLYGISKFILNFGQSRKNYYKIPAYLMVFIGSISFLSYFFELGFSIDNIFIYDSYSTVNNGRMSAATGLCFALCGFALTGINSSKRWLIYINQHLLFIVTIFSLLSIITYILEIPAQNKLFLINTMAIHTAVLFLLTSISISLKHYKIGFNSLNLNSYTGGKLFKQIAPLIIIVPLFLSYFLIYAIKNNLVINESGIVIYTMILIVSGITYVATISYKMTVIDKKRVKLENSLEALVREREQFVYATSHDLQEPVKTVLSLSEELKNSNYQQLDNFGKQGLDYIYSASKTMSLLIKGLMDYCLIGRNNEYELVNLNDLIRSIQVVLIKKIDNTRAKIQFQKLPSIEINKNEVLILFQNLISNALKFRSADRDPIIKIGSQKIKGYWLFYIKDNGIGIHHKHQHKIFVIFQRLHSKKKYPGTGIGLAQCKKIIEQYGGKIWVESKENLGSTFFFTIPDKTDSYGKD